MEMVFIAYDGDGIGNQVGRSVLADDVETLANLSRTIREGHDMICEWVEGNGGEFISGGGDEGMFRLPPEALNQLEEVRQKYYSLVGASATFGIGSKMSEAGKALIYGKLNGKDQIVQYDVGLDEHLKEVHERAVAGEANEIEQKYEEAYLPQAVGDSDEEIDVGNEGDIESDLGHDVMDAMEETGEVRDDEEIIEDDAQEEMIEETAECVADTVNDSLDESREEDHSPKYYGVQVDEESPLGDDSEETQAMDEAELDRNADDYEEDAEERNDAAEEGYEQHIDAQNHENGDTKSVDDAEAEEIAAQLDEEELNEMAEESNEVIDGEVEQPDESEEELAEAIMAYDEEGTEYQEDEDEYEGEDNEEYDEDENHMETLGEETSNRMDDENAEDNVEELIDDMAGDPEYDENAEMEAEMDPANESMEGYEIGEMSEEEKLELKDRILSVLQDFQNNRDAILALQQQAPELFESQMMMLQNMIEMAHALGLDESDSDLEEQIDYEEGFYKSEDMFKEVKRRIEKRFEELNKAEFGHGGSENEDKKKKKTPTKHTKVNADMRGGFEKDKKVKKTKGATLTHDNSKAALESTKDKREVINESFDKNDNYQHEAAGKDMKMKKSEKKGKKPGNSRRASK